jgi:putative lipoic acid-binding regulatory protein
MRIDHILVTALAVALLSLVGPVPSATSSAVAAPAARSAASSADAAPAAKPARRVKFEFKRTGFTYKLYGKVQAAVRKKVLLLRSTTEDGEYRLYRTTRTTARGNYAWENLRASGFYYVKVPSDRRFATSYSQLIEVYFR